MAWRVHLSDDLILQLHILSGKPDVLCAWVSWQEVVFFDLNTGALLARHQIALPAVDDHDSDIWQAFLKTLNAPNGVRLPLVRLSSVVIHSTHEGQQFYEDGHGLTYANGTEEMPLSGGSSPFVSVALDRVGGYIAALDDKGQLWLYHRHTFIGQFDIGLSTEEHILPDVVISDNANAIFASDGYRLVRVNREGKVVKTETMMYFIGQLTCSPDGRYCATSDSETGIIRVYSDEALRFSHQKFAVDLYADARPVQLLASMPTPRLAVAVMALTNNGVLAFAMEGMMTVSHLNKMQKIPSSVTS